METVGMVLFIFVAKALDVTLQTTRTLLMVRGRKIEAAAMGFVEVLLFVVVLGLVMQNLDNVFNMIAYAAGFSAGALVGSLFDERLALGFETVQVVPTLVPSTELVEEIRAAGFGVTTVCGQGRSGPRDLLFVSVKRRAMRSLLDLIARHDPDAFVTVFEARRVKGGVFGSRKLK